MPSPPPPTNPLTIDALLARNSVALARSQRLVDSWLPPVSPPHPPQDDLPNDPEGLPAEMEDGRPSTLGLGAVPLGDGFMGRKGMLGKGSELEKLRETLVGRRRGGEGRVVGGGGARTKGSGVRGGTVGEGNGAGGKRGESSGDEEEGRAAMFVSRRGKRKRGADDGGGATAELGSRSGVGDFEGDSAEPEAQRPTTKQERQSNTRTNRGTYLDEVLAERAKKSSREKKKHKDKEDGTSRANETYP
ncbi:MAG: hypothetical protein M1828_000490 [Chrysothrix sp. TS-e1954]|nr:MAG: hypothetical protein M1828_000490 [Chrysothrix sp. TS-e1954]